MGRFAADANCHHRTQFPKDNGYLLPLKAAARKAGMIGLGVEVTIEILVTADGGFDIRNRAR